MAHIFITNKCNLNCPYCFANKNIQQSQYTDITTKELIKILKWLRHNKNFKDIGLIGGEPTLHPNFSKIITTIYHYIPKVKIHIFSNGLCPFEHLDSFIQCNSLLNINHPNTIKNKTEILNNNLKFFYDHNLFQTGQIKIGINLYKDIPDTQFIFDIANEYNIPEIRISYVAPCKQYQTEVVNKEQYYQDGKELFLNFVEQAKQNNKQLKSDCNHIPICYFSKEEKELIKQVFPNYKAYNCFYCDDSPLDIMPDMTAISCFGINQPINLKDFKNLKEVQDYLIKTQIQPLSLKNQTGKCQDCGQFKCLKCQGGCLSFVS